ncbi:MAG: Ig domain-containing protein [Clostridia bacterium]|nr:Ig domain-containing protein [Clostridia bacterium]
MKNRFLSVFLTAVVLVCALSGGAASAEEWFSEDHAHSYFSYVSINPTCTQAGEEIFECDCGDSYSAALPPLGHEFEDGVCIRCGAADVSQGDGEAPSQEAEEIIPKVIGRAVPKGEGAYQPVALSLSLSKNAKASVNCTDTLEITCVKPVTEWKTAKPDVASIDANGDVCTVTANKPGSVKITAVLENKKKLTVTLTVKDPYLPTGIAFDPAQLSAVMYAGQTLSLAGALKLQPEWATTEYTWKSSNKKVLKVDADGNITALKAGKAKITATTKNKKKASVSIQVTPNKTDNLSPAPDKDAIDAAGGSWMLLPKSAEITGGNVVCEFYLVNGTNAKSSRINNLNLTVAAGSPENVLAQQSFAKVKVACKKQAVKTFKVTLTGNAPENCFLDALAGQLLFVFDESALSLQVGKQAIPYGQKAPTYNKGDIVTFGKYANEAVEWIVLANDGSKALLISRYALEAKAYNDTYADVTWANCTLRAWLNGAFLKNAFSAEEQAKIVQVANQTPDNPAFGTSGGSLAKDRVFLLSTDEATQYFSSEDERAAVPTAHAVSSGASVKNGRVCWWLRSPGRFQNIAVRVTEAGLLTDFGGQVDYAVNCVRPVLWLSLK